MSGGEQQQQLQLSRKPGLVTLENSRRALRDSSHPIPQDMRPWRCGYWLVGVMHVTGWNYIVELSLKLNTCRYFMEFIQTSGTGTWNSLMWNDDIPEGVNFESKYYSSSQIPINPFIVWTKILHTFVLSDITKSSKMASPLALQNFPGFCKEAIPQDWFPRGEEVTFCKQFKTILSQHY